MKYAFLIFSILFYSNLYASNMLKFTGVAYSIEDNQIQYTEEHTQIFNDKNTILSSSVLYKNPNGEVFAEKKLDFLNGQTTPNMTFNDIRTGTKITLSVENDIAALKYISKDDRIDTDINLKGVTVVDAGFDQLLLDEWDSLINGEIVHFQFLAPTRGELINFRVARRSIDDEYLYLVLQPDNWLLRVLVDDINLKYSKENKQIVEFKGLTNIEEFSAGKDTDKYVTAKILYKY